MSATKLRGHDHTLQRSFRVTLIVALVAICVGFAAGLLVTFSFTQRVNDRLAVLEEYIQGRGEYRDREAQRMEEQNEERTRETACAILDGLPSSPLLDSLRGRFGCGPGIPVESLPPEVQQELNGGNRQRLAPPESEAEPRAPMGSAATPTPAPPEPPSTGPEPDPPAPAPTEPEPAPGGLLDPITDPLCQALGLCL